MKLPLKGLLLSSTVHTVHFCITSNNFAYQIATFVYMSSNSFALKAYRNHSFSEAASLTIDGPTYSHELKRFYIKSL